MSTNVKAFGQLGQTNGAYDWKTKGLQSLSFAQGLLQGKTGIIIGFCLILFAFLLVIIYILKQIRSNSFKKGSSFVDDVVKLDKLQSPLEISGADIPKQNIGDQYTFSFWLYVEEHIPTPQTHKLILYRGNKDDVTAANPIVMMDEMSNKLYFVIKTRGSNLSSTDSSIDYKKLKPITEQNYFLNRTLKLTSENHNKHLIIPVNSVPFNRWIHFALSIKDNIITVYQDGEIYAVKTTDDFKQMKPKELDVRGDIIPYDVTIDSGEGTIYIGKNPAIGGNYAVEGYFSKFDFFNYAISVNDAAKIYKDGPYSSSWLKTLGIKNYGIRTPIYKLSTVA